MILGWQRHVALVFQLAHRRQPPGRAGVPDDEHRIASLHAGGATPGEEARAGDWAPIGAICAHQGEVQVVPRIGEVVPVTAEIGHAEFGGDHQADIGVATEDVR